MGFISITLTMLGLGWGIALGLLAGYFMFIYFEPDTVKEPLLMHLNKFDLEALQDIFTEIPLWVKSPDWEKVDWLNIFMQEIWPYLDKAVCKIIRETAEPFITEYKSKYNLEAVEFNSLTLGTLPPVFMGVKVHETREKELIFEIAAKFAGNPNIKVAVKAYGLKAVAQVVDTQVFATARITLKPLVSRFPCFSGICISLMETPHVDFGLKVLNTDLMAIPGLYRYVQGILKQTVARMYLWPNKLEVPVLDDSTNVSKQAQGVLVVTVLRAKHLRKKDVLGKSDPYVTLKVAGSSQKTKVVMNNLNPEWNETFSLIVEDPETDLLYISVYDWDKVGSHDKLGVQVVPLNLLTPDIVQSFTLTLLKNSNENDLANKKSRGEITLELHYKPFDGNDQEDIDELDSSEDKDSKRATVTFDPSPNTILPKAPPGWASAGGGLLLVIIHKAEELEGKHHTNPYVIVIFRGEKRKTEVMKKSRNPHWEAEFEYVLDDSPIKDRLLLEIKSKRRRIMYQKESLGRVEIDLSDVVRNRRINEKYQLSDSKNGKVHVELQWRSTGALSGAKSPSAKSPKSPTALQGNHGGKSPLALQGHHGGKSPTALQGHRGGKSPTLEGHHDQGAVALHKREGLEAISHSTYPT